MDQFVKFVFALLALYVLHSVFSTKETNNYYTTKECYGGQEASKNAWRCYDPNILVTTLPSIGRHMSFSVERTNGNFPDGNLILVIPTQIYDKKRNIYRDSSKSIYLNRDSNNTYSIETSKNSITSPEMKLKFVPTNKDESYSLCEDLNNLTIQIQAR